MGTVDKTTLLTPTALDICMQDVSSCESTTPLLRESNLDESSPLLHCGGIYENCVPVLNSDSEQYLQGRKNMNNKTMDNLMKKDLNVLNCSTPLGRDSSGHCTPFWRDDKPRNSGSTDAHRSHHQENKLDTSHESNSSNEQVTVECGSSSVSMKSGEKQEWSVTLYDVDSKTSVSEEDLARLVTMLYKVAGHSITQKPQNSSKKIKLRLSVAPDSPAKIVNQSLSEKDETNSGAKIEDGKKSGEHLGAEMKMKEHLEESTFRREKPRKETRQHAEKRDHRSRRRHAVGFDEGADKENKEMTYEGNKVRAASVPAMESRHRYHTHRKRYKKRNSKTIATFNEPATNLKIPNPASPSAEENKDRRQYYQHLMGIESECLAKTAEVKNEVKDENEVKDKMSTKSSRSTDAAPVGNANIGEKHSKSRSKSQVLEGKTMETSHLHPHSEQIRKHSSTKPDTQTVPHKNVHFETETQTTVLTTQIPDTNTPPQKSHHHKKQYSSKLKNSVVVNPFHSNQHRPKSCQLTVEELLSREQCEETSFDEKLENQIDCLYALKHGVLGTADVDSAEIYHHHHHNYSEDIGCHVQPNPGFVKSPGQLANPGPSMHQLRRHRNREENHMRAMRQVAAWIQQQPSIVTSGKRAPNLMTSQSNPLKLTPPTQLQMQQQQSKPHTHHEKNGTHSKNKVQTVVPNTDTGKIHVLKHEHHHVHEHHHHYHFYHYYET